MKVILEKRPKNATIISGFPGFGLVVTITTEFLIKHLNAVPIGKIRVDEVAPVIAIHNGEPVEPLGIFYDKKYKLIILHALGGIDGIEWKLSDLIVKTAKELDVKEIVSVEGVGSNNPTAESKAFYLGSKNVLKQKGVDKLQEGIIVGVTGALLLRKDVNITSIFAETHSQLPDSRAAAKVIEVLDKYLGLKVDYKPLIKNAEKFESKIKEVMDKKKEATILKEDKKLSYFG